MPYRRVIIYHKNSNQALAFLPFAPVASGLTGTDIPCRPMTSAMTALERASFNAPRYDLLPHALFARLLPWPGHHSAQTVVHFP